MNPALDTNSSNARVNLQIQVLQGQRDTLRSCLNVGLNVLQKVVMDFTGMDDLAILVASIQKAIEDDDDAAAAKTHIEVRRILKAAESAKNIRAARRVAATVTRLIVMLDDTKRLIAEREEPK